jgi:hypothetical protein
VWTRTEAALVVHATEGLPWDLVCITPSRHTPHTCAGVGPGAYVELMRRFFALAGRNSFSCAMGRCALSTWWMRQRERVACSTGGISGCCHPFTSCRCPSLCAAATWLRCVGGGSSCCGAISRPMHAREATSGKRRTAEQRMTARRTHAALRLPIPSRSEVSGLAGLLSRVRAGCHQSSVGSSTPSRVYPPYSDC